MSIVHRLTLWGSLIKFSHSIFALPFALIMMVVVMRDTPVHGWQIAVMIVCVVAARMMAMTFNRIADVDIDRENPRTRTREIPAGKVKLGEAWGLLVLSAVVFLGGAALLGMHCLAMAPLVMIILLGYSLLKRYTAACHYVLGLALACAPGGVWYAITAEWSWKPVSLMVAVLLWVAGFDILYSCQDEWFDRERKLFSIPSRWGLRRALMISRVLHVGTIAALIVFGRSFDLGVPYAVGVVLFAALLVNQHRIVAVRGIESVNQVFVTRNGAASVALFVAVMVDAWSRW